MSDTVASVIVVCLALCVIAAFVTLGLVVRWLVVERDHLVVRDGKELAQVKRAQQAKTPPRTISQEEQWVLDRYADGEPQQAFDLPEGLSVG